MSKPTSSLPSSVEDALQKQRDLVDNLEKKRLALTEEVVSLSGKSQFYQDQLVKLKEAARVENIKLGAITDEVHTDEVEAENTKLRLKEGIDILEKAKAKASDELAGLTSQIKEREQYAREQEEQINAATLVWQDSLRDMQGQYNKLSDEKDALLRGKHALMDDVSRFEAAVDDTKLALKEANDKLRVVDEVYEKKSADYRQRLDAILTEAKKITSEAEELDLKSQKRAEQLDYREKSLEVRQRLVEEAEADLELRGRRLASESSLRGIPNP